MKSTKTLILTSLADESRDNHSDGNSGDPAAHRAARPGIAVTLECFIPGEIKDVFDFVAAQDVLPKILTGYGLVPGVASTSDISGPWNRPGSTRTVHLLDGSTVREGLTHYDRPDFFAYRVSDPSFSLKHLMSHACGQWWFVALEGGTQAKWAYTFHARNGLAAIPLRLFVGTQWKGYMKVCLNNIVDHFNAA
ncbi:SRPBCC family protein [Vreelandella neptunia]|uniref:SRPBCC family protein n=1 Tax=Vreelandella neptunia TaxID=115551 RepID=A0ABZ0YND2_9GAMM|nr:SRPBCC family protein [Halomonas neptunia]MDN3558680.1 SRPBCC family protein [Halomonas neptunia]TDV92147.1 polyketide cyclase/dehydrase/lipid transport protein [Halomonas alkaliantarctica]WQH13649.1 SRPBCC family protein [Halomonas neptunia]